MEVSQIEGGVLPSWFHVKVWLRANRTMNDQIPWLSVSKNIVDPMNMS